MGHPIAHDRQDIKEGVGLGTRVLGGEAGEATLDTGQSYLEGEPIRIFIRKRGRRYDLDDRGRATLAGEPRRMVSGRRARVILEDGFNVNRAGVVFVPAVERDLARLMLRLADTSRAPSSTSFSNS